MGSPSWTRQLGTHARMADSVTDCSWDSVRGQDSPGDPGWPGHWVSCLNSSTWGCLPWVQVTSPSAPFPQPARTSSSSPPSLHQAPPAAAPGTWANLCGRSASLSLLSLLFPHPPLGSLAGLAVSPLPIPQPWWPESPAQRTSGLAPPTGGFLRPGRPSSIRSCIKNKGSQFNLNFR